MHVTKLVVLVTRIPKHLGLYFSDFSTNFYVFSKFSLETNEKGLKTCIQDPRILKVFAGESLARVRAGEGGLTGRFRWGSSPAARVEGLGRFTGSGRTCRCAWPGLGWSEKVGPL